MDFQRHNEEARRVWESFNAGRPIRVPVGSFTIGPRVWILDPALNKTAITWETFSTDPRVMFDVQLQYKHFLHHHVVHDIEMGIPAEGWEIFTEFVNTAEAAWFGCEIFYPPGQVTASRPAYAGDRKHAIFDRGIPDPFSGMMGTIREFYEYFVERARREEFHGKPIKVLLPGHALDTNGPMTVAVDLRGDDIFIDMIEDPEYVEKLFDFIIEAKVKRVRAWRKYLGMEERPAVGGTADDAIAMISTAQLKEQVLPYQRKLMRELFGAGPHAMHLCGNVQRHLPTLVRELNIGHFDTGFPINFESLRTEIGPNVRIDGGVPVSIMLDGTPEQVKVEAKRIIQSGIADSGRFVLKEANNMPPRTPLKNIAALLEAACEVGWYEDGKLRVKI